MIVFAVSSTVIMSLLSGGGYYLMWAVRSRSRDFSASPWRGVIFFAVGTLISIGGASADWLFADVRPDPNITTPAMLIGGMCLGIAVEYADSTLRQ